jgi:mitochondrial pyruvate carrier 2
MKWGLVIAGAADMTRPAEQLSLSQNFALMCTGAIWTRWCFVIRPKNIFLATVNFFLFLVGAAQVTRITLYKQSVKNVESQAEKEGKELKGELKDVAAKAEKAIKS